MYISTGDASACDIESGVCQQQGSQRTCAGCRPASTNLPLLCAGPGPAAADAARLSNACWREPRLHAAAVGWLPGGNCRLPVAAAAASVLCLRRTLSRAELSCTCCTMPLHLCCFAEKGLPGEPGSCKVSARFGMKSILHQRKASMRCAEEAAHTTKAAGSEELHSLTATQGEPQPLTYRVYGAMKQQVCVELHRPGCLNGWKCCWAAWERQAVANGAFSCCFITRYYYGVAGR